MPTGVLPLSELAKRLSRKESEVDRLRHQYETRLGRLKERQQKLESELREVEGQIQAASPNGSVPPAPLPEEPVASAAGRMILKDFIIALIKEAGKPLTVQELAEEVRRRKYPTKSKNIPDLVQVRLYDMVRKGILAHASGQPGYIVRSSLNGQQGSPTKRGPGRKAKVAKAPVHAGIRGSQPPLREVLTKILEQCKEPIGGGELAQKALETGYKSNSKRFQDVVWVSLGNMKNVVHIPGKGYRLKKR
jgi:hypothetical protein